MKLQLFFTLLPFPSSPLQSLKAVRHPRDYIWRLQTNSKYIIMLKQQAFVSTSMPKSFTNFTRRITWAVPDSDQSRSRGDLISERISNLGSSKRQPSLVEFQKSFEIQENPLCSFWSQVSGNINKSVCYKGGNYVFQ